MSKPPQQTFHFCPKCGQPVSSIGNNPFRCEACAYTYYFGPTLAVGGIIADPQGRVLLIRRAREPGKGKWGLPGGFVDLGETAEAAVAREIREEVRLQADQVLYLCSYTNSYDYRGIIIPVVDLFYTCKIHSFADMQREPAEVTELAFCHLGPEHLDNMAFESNRLALLDYISRR